MSSNSEGRIVKLFADQCYYAWEIYDYCYCTISDKERFSSEFKDNNDNVWYFKLKKESIKPGHYLGLYLYLKSCENAAFRFDESLTVEFGFLEKYNNCSKVKNVSFNSDGKYFYNSYYINSYTSNHQFCELVKNVKLTMFCKIKNIQLKKFKNNKFHGLSNDLEQLFKNEKFSDVMIVVGEKIFHAHKGILASRSPVFSAMFENEMKENKINVTDFNQDVMQEVLRFVYTGKIENHEIAIDILAAAEKYAIEDLKMECLEILNDNLKIDNVIRIFTISDLYKLDSLKKIALEFIIVHAAELIETPPAMAISDS